jgi:hypothetical protein
VLGDQFAGQPVGERIVAAHDQVTRNRAPTLLGWFRASASCVAGPSRASHRR